MNTLQDFEQLAPFDPLLSRIHSDGRTMTDVEATESWKPLRDVSEDVYLLLSSSLVAGALYRMQQSLQLSEDIVLRIAALMRMYYFGKAPFEQFPLFLKNDVGLLQEKIAVVMNFIRTEILPLKAPVKSEKDDEMTTFKTNIVSLQLLQALEKYPKVNDQQITNERIKIRSEKETVRGTVRNWMRAYRDSAGVRAHSAMERGSFLFQSENAKNLSSAERDKVAVLLKSLDDQEQLAINPQRQEIVFPVATTTQKTNFVPVSPLPPQQPIAPTMPAVAPAPPMKTYNFSPSAPASPIAPTVPVSPGTNHFHFSSGQMLPAEKQTLSEIGQANQSQASFQGSSFGLGYSGQSFTPKKKEVWQVPDTLQNIVDLRSNE